MFLLTIMSRGPDEPDGTVVVLDVVTDVKEKEIALFAQLTFIGSHDHL